MAGGINLWLPYQSDPEIRKRINAGEMDYMNIQLSHVAQFVDYGFLGKLDVALIEVAGVLEDRRLLPSSSIGNNNVARPGGTRDPGGQFVAACGAGRDA